MPPNCSWIEWTSDQAADLAADSDLISFFHRYFLCPKWAQICVISWAQARYVCIKGNRQSIPHLLIQLFYSLFASDAGLLQRGLSKTHKIRMQPGLRKIHKIWMQLGVLNWPWVQNAWAAPLCWICYACKETQQELYNKILLKNFII